MLAVPPRGAQRVAVVALLSVPLVVVTVPVALVVLVSVALPWERRRFVLDLLDRLVGWTLLVAGCGGPGEGCKPEGSGWGADTGAEAASGWPSGQPGL